MGLFNDDGPPISDESGVDIVLRATDGARTIDPTYSCFAYDEVDGSEDDDGTISMAATGRII